MLPLTKIEGVPHRDEIVPGMAFYAGTGPFEAKCKGCKFYGYYRESKKGKSYRTMACLMFKKMTGKFGPRLKPHTPACKYFELKPKKVT